MTTHKVEDWWWENDNTFCFLDKETEEIHRLEGCYLADISFEGLDSDCSDSVELCENRKMY